MNTVNVTYLEEVCGGSKEIIREMVDIFIGQVPEFYSEMQSLYNDGKYHELGLMAHKAKSSVAIMGMDSLAGKLKELELLAKAGENTGEYSNYIHEFHIETEKAIRELEEYTNKM
jgi:HPt (histidine-containing phosphotransfer) domain-containing protein